MKKALEPFHLIFTALVYPGTIKQRLAERGDAKP